VNEPDPKLAELGRDLARLVRVDWNHERARRTELGLVGRRRRKIARTWILTAAAVGALALVGWRLHAPDAGPSDEPSVPVVAQVSNRPNVVSPPDAAMPASDPVVVKRAARKFSDGSTAVPLVDDAELEVVREDAEQIVIALGTGATHFDVAPVPSRTFRVTACRAARTRCEDISIDVIAAKFAVARETHHVHIEVYEGLLQVTSPDGVRELGTGTTYDIPSNARPAPKRDVAIAPEEPISAEATPAASSEEPSAAANEEPVAVVPAPVAPPARDALDELLLAADHKRREGDYADAVALLRQILRDHAADARAPLVAFTLGRVLLQLKRPAEAAEAFATADRLAPHGPMAQDAVARQVEALALAGNTAGARGVAQSYIARFPDGRRLAAVRAWGGL
jgi:transmembrane sensor